MAITAGGLHLNTPLILSRPLSERVGCRTWLKLDALQPSGSFKVRGIGNATQKAVERGCTKLVSSSGGNAGLATAFCGNVLGVDTTVCLPETATPLVKRKIEALGAKVIVHGSQWVETNSYAEGLVAEAAGKAALMHPFDLPDIWEGNTTLIEEIADQLPVGVKPSIIFASVGGGGLLMGLLLGLKAKSGWREAVQVVACETVGANALAASLEKKERVELEAITSVAKTLGADKIGEEILRECMSGDYMLDPFVVTDAEAVGSCLKFALDHNILIEPASGASLAPLYYYPERVRAMCRGGAPMEDIVVEVCGGGAFNSIETLSGYARDLGLDMNGNKVAGNQ